MSIRIDGTNTTANPGITGSDTDTGLQFGTNEVKIVTDGSDQVTVDSSGNVGIGVSSPVRPLHVDGTAFVSGTAPQLRLNGGAGDSNDDDRAMFGLATDSGHFFSGSAAGDAVLRSANGGDLLFGSGTNERMRLLSGGGLTFNGDTAAANALSDYEEGTFTPTYASGMNSPGYQVQEGSYTKIGDLVTCFIEIKANSGTNNSSHLGIGGLPFTASNTKDQGGGYFGYRDDLVNSGENVFLHVPKNSSILYFYTQGGSTWAGNDGNGIYNRNIHVQVQYFT